MLETVVDHQDGFSGDFESHLSILGLIEVEACHHAFEHEIESWEVVVARQVEDLFGLMKRRLLKVRDDSVLSLTGAIRDERIDDGDLELMGN